MNENELVTSIESKAVESEPILSSDELKPSMETVRNESGSQGSTIVEVDFCRVAVPDHRLKALKESWMEIYLPVLRRMKIDINMNLKTKKVELKTNAETPELMNLIKSADFVYACILGFDVKDAISLLIDPEIFLQSFEINYCQSCAIRRFFAKHGNFKNELESLTTTIILTANDKIHIFGTLARIGKVRDTFCKLLFGFRKRQGLRSCYRSS